MTQGFGSKSCPRTCACSDSSGLKPIVKWAGGKERELKYILPCLPQSFDDYYEPFVGGGAVFMAIAARRYFINDLSVELATLYRSIADQDQQFYGYARHIDAAWAGIGGFCGKYACLVDWYLQYRCDDLPELELERRISQFCAMRQDEILSLLGPDFSMHHDVLMSEMGKNMMRKMKRMRALEQSRHALPDKDLCSNIEAAIKGAYYMYYRHLYNNHSIMRVDGALHCALFLFIRNFCYSGMFRYNDRGDFNVPYGGIAYNAKSMAKKIGYYQSQELQAHFERVSIDNLDFEQFLMQRRPKENDFVFLDPPYDSEFSTYAQNEFDRADQRRLANYLLQRCRAKWMLVIKNTEFIYQLYDQPGINIRAFDRKYQVSFMNRNERQVTHLLITNY